MFRVKSLYKSTLIMGVLFSCIAVAMDHPKRIMADSSYRYEIEYISHDTDVDVWIAVLSWQDSRGRRKKQRGQLADNKGVFGVGPDEDDDEFFRIKDSTGKKYYFMPYCPEVVVDQESGASDSDLEDVPCLIGPRQRKASPDEPLLPTPDLGEKKIGMTVIIEYEDDDFEPYLPWNYSYRPPERPRKMKTLKITI